MENSNAKRESLARLLTSDVKKDLHIHTIFSDGKLSPQQIIDRWADEGYQLISITDHDGVDGSLVGNEYAKDKDITFVRGIEFDSKDDLASELHILGYGYDENNPQMKDALRDIRLERARRNDRFMEQLNRMGYNVTLDDVGAVNEGRYIGKPTFAVALMKKGFLNNYHEAFETIFKDPQLKSIKKGTYATKDVIDIIHAAGGIAVLAHPMEQRNEDESWEDFEPRLRMLLDRMVEYGIDGIECYHPSANEDQSEYLRNYAEEHDLLITRGSDFHTDSPRRDYSRYNRP